MKVATWNVRGFGNDQKKSMVKRLIRSEKIELIGLTETKAQEINAWDLRKCWGNCNADWEQISARQNSGGILVTWKQQSFVKFNSFAMQRWMCIVGEITETKTKCVFCVVYAPNSQGERQIVWDQLRRIKAQFQLPWIFMGDFNEVLHIHERRGATELSQGMREFQNLVFDLQLIDMDIGQNFTWFRRNAASRIDRIMVDKAWLDCFPLSKAYCQARGFSDHFPVILTSVQEDWGPIPFRTLDCWLEEPSFLNTFKKEWVKLSDLPLEKRLKLIKKPLKDWNRKSFGHIEQNIGKFQKEIDKLESVAQDRELQEEEWSRLEALRTQLGLWTTRNERYWRQMSRCKWIKEGDRNTKYFHLAATMRRQRNQINKLKIEGDEISDIKLIKAKINDYFRQLYKRRRCTTFDITQIELPKLSQEERLWLEEPISKEEILEALTSCDPAKAPGYDGFNLKCIKKLWPILGEEICAYILQFFETGRLHASLNTTWVTLIPKKQGLLEVTDLRPISLVGCIYKVIAKVLSKRLKAVLPKLISENQTAFVHGRQILDGILVANEVVSWMKKKKKPGILLKMDFHKAYDTVDWAALDSVMEVMGFGLKWRHWISQCLSTASISLIINGSPSKPFKMERGIRQGDPLSPFLFVLVAEVLNKMMHRAVSTGLIRGISVGVGGLQISHLQFADDTLVLCEAEEQYARVIKGIFLTFQAFTGLCVNYKKSTLVVLGKDEAWVDSIEEILGCSRAQLPIQYLGTPLGANMRKAASWQKIIEKVQTRLKAWKSNCLSRAGRLILIKSVLNSLPLYYLSLFKVPKKVANDIVRLQRKFLWCGSKEGRYMPLVNWEVVMKQKSEGGLGVGDIVSKNAALLLKWWWRFASEEDALWKTVVQAIHNEKEGRIPDEKHSNIPGPWQNVKRLLNDQGSASLQFLQQLRVEVGNGEKTRFWEDPWMQDGVLKQVFPELYKLSTQKHNVIARMGWFEGQEWRWVLAWRRELTHEEIQKVDALQRCLQHYKVDQSKDDRLWWGTEKCYTVKALQKQLSSRDSSRDSCDNLVCKAWMKLAPPKVEFFMWLALLGKLNTKEVLWRKGILQEDQLECPFCSAPKETVDHILMDCPTSWEIWSLIAKDMHQNIPKPMTFRQHFEGWITRKWNNTIMKKFWQSTFFAIAWSLWKMRNEVVFQQKVVDVVALYNLTKWRIIFWSKAWMDKNSYTEEEMVRHFSDIPVILQ